MQMTKPMHLRQDLLVLLAIGTLVLPIAAPSQTGTGNNNGNGNVGSGNGNCNSGSNNGNGNTGNNKGNGSIDADDQRRLQLKQLQEQLKDIPLSEEIWKLLPDCLR